MPKKKPLEFLAEAISDGRVIIDGECTVLIKQRSKRTLHDVSGVLRKQVESPHSLPEYNKYLVRECALPLKGLCKRFGLTEPELVIKELQSKIV